MPKFPYQNPDLPLEERIDDLLGRMTPLEKIGQMMHDNHPIERLEVPAYNWWNEACHGVGRAGRATVFPQVIGLAATWNRELVGQVATAISDEARAKHHDAARRGKRGIYRGLTFWTPNVNIVRDPRWGRGQEAFGEDPFLTAELATCVVHGLQGDDDKYLKVAACAKHYAVHSGPESERHEFDAQPTQKDLWETYLPAFERLSREGVEAFMGAYNRTLGEACCASDLLINQILRGQWGFEGHYVSDCGAIDDFHLYHQVTSNAAESAALAVRMGCDLNCGCTFNDLSVALEKGRITEAEIDTAVRRLLSTKFRLGLFDPEERVQWTQLPLEIVDGPEHRQLARRAAAESAVLLKNAGNVLPLNRDPERLLVVGPTAANYGALLGNYYGVSPEMVTIFQGILEATEPNTAVKYRPGCPILSPQAPGVNYTFPAAEVSDVVIAVMGLDHTLEGEEGDTVASSSGGDRDRVELPEVQMNFLRELRQHSKKLVLVLTGGSAIAAPEAHELADAVLFVGYPGCEGGRGVADVLFGTVAPSGRMPFSTPMRTEDLPAFNDYHLQGRTYRFADKTPLYPFGFGLTYGTSSYRLVSPSTATLRPEGLVEVEVEVRNEGQREFAETVQCYVVPPKSWPNAPHATLVGFEKVTLPAGGSKRVSFQLPAKSFSQFDAEGRRVLPAGEYRVVVGTSSPNARSQELGAPVPAECTVTLASELSHAGARS
ncbi:MAG: glycoside hydrolase family 3 C-terminal domain-containing protein [Verrucomicrobiota bacterium JB022]|nr:glycoside hydrolase family 3 C-terminal domain-containing protein [Verrucomicrobiota bacterium JB022]